MFVDFFIRRPVFATVCALLIVIAGGVCIPGLPVGYYPQLAAPQVTVSASYLGATADVVESAVTTPLEQQINGVEGMAYMTSISSNDGSSTITVTFDVSRDPDLAAVDVQNRVGQVLGRLPDAVKITGIAVNKNSSSFVLAAGLYAEHDEYEPLFLSNYADVYLKDALKRVKGVGDVRIFGERKYAMRLWLDPGKLAARALTASDVLHALSEQNVEIAAGQIDQQPGVPGQTYQLSVRAIGRLRDADDFGRLILKTAPDGTLVTLRDVGRAELGAEDYTSALKFNGKPSVGLGILALPTANALDVGRDCTAELARLSLRFPPGVKYKIAFDTTEFVKDSISEVLVTLFEAIGLVILVIFAFLGTVRSTIIPTITIPVSLIGTFAFVKLLGFTINTLTLFGITLATGLVVDDAIVVIENIERYIEEKRMKPREASSAAMGEVAGAVIATSLVLIAVFVPVAFLPGTTGRIYKQFSLTIAISVGISAFNALTLTPALSALLLKERQTSTGFVALVNRIIVRVRDRYGAFLTGAIRHRAITIVAFVAALGATAWVSKIVPTSFIPDEDQGYLIIAAQTPEGSSLDFTRGLMDKAEAILTKQPEVADVFSVAGFSFAGNGPNKGILFVRFVGYDQRKGPEHSAAAILSRIRGPLLGLSDGLVIPFMPPSIQGVGSLGGFQFEVLDQSGSSVQELSGATWGIIGRGSQDNTVKGLFSTITANDPQLVIEVNREKAKALDVSFSEITDTLQAMVGSEYVNDFDFANRAYRVYVMAEARYRANPRQIGELYVRNGRGEMLPLESVVTTRIVTAPQTISHFNMFRSAEINGAAGEGFSSGQAITSMERLAHEVLPQGMGFAWSGLSLEEIQSGSTSLVIFGFGLVVVFLVLAAQYESFALPFIVLLGVPVAVLGALLAQLARGLQNDIFCQVGLLMLIGLASKNAILIVEFANQLRERGLPIVESAIEAAKTRLRPILMTSFAFILGVVPLVVATGAGQASRHSLGTAVFGGMLVSTVLNLAIIPVLYVVFETWREGGKRRPDPE